MTMLSGHAPAPLAADGAADAAAAAGRWRVRVDLAALYRVFVHYGWTDLTYTHISARVPDRADRYLINPYGLLFEEITASNLIEVDFAGNVTSGRFPYNKAGHITHSTVLRARPEINFVLHSHTRAAVAVSAMRCGLLPLSQPAMIVSETLARHPYDVADDGPEECERLVRDLGEKYVMLLHNHGLLVCGRTAAEAFLYHYFAQQACEIQVDALRAGVDPVAPPPDVVAKISAWSAPRAKPWGGRQWDALMRMLDRVDPSFRS